MRQIGRVKDSLAVPANYFPGPVMHGTGRVQTDPGTRTEAMRLAVQLDPLLVQVPPAGNPLADALQAIGTVVAAARLRLGLGIGSPTSTAMVIGKSLLRPLRT